MRPTVPYNAHRCKKRFESKEYHLFFSNHSVLKLPFADLLFIGFGEPKPANFPQPPSRPPGENGVGFPRENTSLFEPVSEAMEMVPRFPQNPTNQLRNHPNITYSPWRRIQCAWLIVKKGARSLDMGAQAPRAFLGYKPLGLSLESCAMNHQKPIN